MSLPVADADRSANGRWTIQVSAASGFALAVLRQNEPNLMVINELA